jgi:cytochrome c biogenesis protein CcmG/thiol:disulfide interchange protein DsbE
MASSSTRQWVYVAAIVGGLGLGAWALATFSPIPEGAEVGQRAPDFRAMSLTTGDSVSFREAYKGSVTLVNIWATWCVPCRAEMPAMEQLYSKLKDRGFRIAAVSIDEGNVDDVRAFARDLGLTFDILHDKSGEIEKIYQTTGVPESFLVDREGTIIRKQIGEHPWNSPANHLIVEELLGKSDGQ